MSDLSNFFAGNSLDDAGVATHELFMAYVRAGFTRDEALQLTKGLVIEQMRFVYENLKKDKQQ